MSLYFSKLNIALVAFMCLQLHLSAQNVGIGTTAPDARLHIAGSGNPLIMESSTTLSWMSVNTSGGYKGYLGVYTGPNDMDFGTGVGNNTGKVHLVTRALPRLTISSGGNVGIGMQSPLQKLEVNGKLKIGNDATVPTAGTIRFNPDTNDFEGYDGTQWKSLTKPAFSKLIYKPEVRDRSVPSSFGYPFMGDFASDGHFLLVGNRLGHIDPATHRGSVEVYIRNSSTNTYNYQSRFQDVEAADFSSFGSTILFYSGIESFIFPYLRVAISNPTQPGPNGAYNGGRVSLFERNSSFNSFFYETGINGPNGSRLGHAMAITGDSLLVSLPGTNTCRLYTLGTGTFNLRFSFNRPAADNGTYGDAVAVGNGGNVLAIASTQASAAGRVYIFRRSGAFFNTPATITAPNNEPQFGKTLQYTNNELFVGAGNRVYVYNNNITNTLKQTLTPDNTTQNSDFGAAFAYNPNEESVYVGAPLDNSAGGGMVYKYTRNGSGTFELTERIYDFGGTQVGSNLKINTTANVLFSRARRCDATTIATFNIN